MKSKENTRFAYALFVISIIIIIYGVRMIIGGTTFLLATYHNNINPMNGFFLILLAIVTLIIGYHHLDPYSRIKRFFQKWF